MKQLIFQVYVGKRSKLYDHCVDSVSQYAKKHGIDHIVLKNPILRIKPNPFTTGRSKEAVARLGYLPIFEKENAFTYLRTYDQVAVIDSDVWVRPSSSNIFDKVPPEKFDFGGVVERDMPITAKYKSKILNYSKMQYGSIRNVNWKWNDAGAEFMNMGVMVMNKSIEGYLNGETPLQFLSRPRFQPFVDGVGPWKWSTDQTLLNTWIKEENMSVKHLTFHWNALYGALQPGKVKEANFVHFFLKDKLPNRGENVEGLMNNVQ